MGDASKLERVLAALEHRPVDRVPAFLLGADFSFYRTFLEQGGFDPEQFARFVADGVLQTPPVNHALAVALGFDCDWMTVPSLVHFEPEERQLVDTWGAKLELAVQPDGTPHQWFVGPHLDTPEKIRDWWDRGRPEGYPKILFGPIAKRRRVLLEKYDGFLTFVGLAGPFECCVFGIGLAQFAKFARHDPAFLREVLERNFEVQERGLKKLLQSKPPVVMCGDDYGFNEGLQCSATHWRQFVKPVLAKYVEVVHSAGAKFVLHSCGNIGEIFPDFVELGIDGVESLQPGINDLPHLKRKFGDRLAILGTIDDTDLLVNGTPAQVRERVAEQVRSLGRGGGYLPGPTNFLLNAKVENVRAMVEAIHSTRP
ncbi:MAG: hypothetical protein Kow0069_00510 [Promethearchaeota archaeon]